MRDFDKPIQLGHVSISRHLEHLNNAPSKRSDIHVTPVAFETVLCRLAPRSHLAAYAVPDFVATRTSFTPRRREFQERGGGHALCGGVERRP